VTTRCKALLCNCNRTMQVDEKAIAGALQLDAVPTVSSELCRREVSSFEAAVKSGEDLLIACTQEAPLFAELHEEMGATREMRFVGIRETAGWSEQGARFRSVTSGARARRTWITGAGLSDRPRPVSSSASIPFA
jgi:hypothetical protein